MLAPKGILEYWKIIWFIPFLYLIEVDIFIDVATSTCKVSFDVKGKIFTLKNCDGKDLLRDKKRIGKSKY